MSGLEREVHYFQKACLTMGGRWSSSNKKIWAISGSSSLVSASGIASSPEDIGLPNIWPRLSKVDAYFAIPLSLCCIEPQTSSYEPNTGDPPRELVFKGVWSLGKDTKLLSGTGFNTDWKSSIHFKVFCFIPRDALQACQPGLNHSK